MTATLADVLYAISNLPDGDLADLFEMLMVYIDTQEQRIEKLERALTADKRTLEERLLPQQTATLPDPIEMFARLNTPPRYFKARATLQQPDPAPDTGATDERETFDPHKNFVKVKGGWDQRKDGDEFECFRCGKGVTHKSEHSYRNLCNSCEMELEDMAGDT